jgi:hypothetical protein
MEKKEKPGTGQTFSAGARPFRLIPPGLFAFFFIMELWVLALFLTGAGAGWPDEGLGFLARTLTLLGILSCAAALCGIVFSTVETLVLKRAFPFWSVLARLVLGATGLALGILGGGIETIAAIAAGGPLQGVP